MATEFLVTDVAAKLGVDVHRISCWLGRNRDRFAKVRNGMWVGPVEELYAEYNCRISSRPAETPEEVEDISYYRRELLAASRRLVSRDDYSRVVELAVREAVADCAPLPSFVASKRTNGGPSYECVLMLSDLHIGAGYETSLDRYDYGAAESVLNELFDRFTRVVHDLKNPPKVIHLAMLGDMVEGDEIYPGQPYAILDGAAVQMAHAMVLIDAFVRGIAIEFPDSELRVYGVPGNHGRASKTAHPHSNWDMGLYRALAAMWRKEIVLPDSRTLFVLLNGIPTMMHHGHIRSMKSHAGIPWYGIQRHLGTLFQKFSSCYNKELSEVPVGLFLCGHYHQVGQAPFGRMLGLSNGSTLGISDHSFEETFAPAPRQQVMLTLANGRIVGHHTFWLR